MRHLILLLTASLAVAQPPVGQAPPAHRFDLLLKHGRIIDDANGIDWIGDLGLKDGKIAAVARSLEPLDATKVVDATGLLVTPGLIDIHVHVYAGTGERGSYAGDNSVYPDGFTFRTGVTTVVDAGGSGWRNFDDFKNRVIDRSRTRVLADLNIVGSGMRGEPLENDVGDMDGQRTGEKARQFPGLIVGIKTAHFKGPDWKPFDQAVVAGDIAHVPVMVDYGTARPERPLLELVSSHLRPGDIYTHCFSGFRGEQDPKTGGPSEALLVMRRRGIFCDLGHGGGSFVWDVAQPIVRSGYWPDSLSTDLHVFSMNGAMKDLLNVAGKMLALGETVPHVIAQMTSHPAREIRQQQLGSLTVGAVADVTVLSLQTGEFGFLDRANIRVTGKQKLQCELTLKDGKVVYDLNGLAADRR